MLAIQNECVALLHTVTVLYGEYSMGGAFDATMQNAIESGMNDVMIFSP